MRRANRVYKKREVVFSRKIHLTVTEAMWERVWASAEKAGLPMTEHVRYMIADALDRT